MNIEEILESKKHLLKLLSNTDGEREITDILNRLNQTKATAELLSKTEIGITVNKYRKHENSEISQLAKNLVKKWKKDIDIAQATKDAKEANVENEAVVSTDDDLQINIVKKQRTCKTDNIKFKSVGLPVRDKSLEILYTALASNTDAASALCQKTAVELELQIYKLFFAESQESYTEKVRSIFLNLRDASNPNLRIRVLSRSLDVSTFCQMSAEEMKSKERQEEEERLKEENLFKARGAVPQEAETDQFKCGKCKQRKCRYYQMQTRSADEPMTTFVTCVNCNNKWKF